MDDGFYFFIKKRKNKMGGKNGILDNGNHSLIIFLMPKRAMIKKITTNAIRPLCALSLIVSLDKTTLYIIKPIKAARKIIPKI